MFAQQIVPIHYIWTQVQQIDAAAAAAGKSSRCGGKKESGAALAPRKMLCNKDKLDSNR